MHASHTWKSWQVQEACQAQSIMQKACNSQKTKKKDNNQQLAAQKPPASFNTHDKEFPFFEWTRCFKTCIASDNCLGMNYRLSHGVEIPCFEILKIHHHLERGTQNVLIHSRLYTDGATSTLLSTIFLYILFVEAHMSTPCASFQPAAASWMCSAWNAQHWIEVLNKQECTVWSLSSVKKLGPTSIRLITINMCATEINTGHNHEKKVC